jgi:flagellar basal body-associated protein FliL
LNGLVVYETAVTPNKKSIFKTEDKMKSRSGLFMLLVVALMLFLAACGGAAAPTSSEVYQVAPAATEAPAMPETFASQDSAAKTVGDIPQEQAALAPMPTAVAYEITNGSGDLTVIERSNRMIVKNADIKLTVKDTDVAIDRATQIIGDAGGYIVSSRVWYQDYYGNNLKYATITIGVPVEEFEKVLSRLRGLAIKVVDETASGDDVTDQYVDLQSQLTNLEATRARIQEFLKDAKTIDEALRINQELSNIEAQIEQIKGRMNYLNDRSAYSTITLNLEPEFPVLTPTPTATPYPTATPIPWNPNETFTDAKSTVTVLYQGIADFLIWLGVVILPIVLPPALILWAIWKFLNRKTVKVASAKSEGD